VNNLFLNGSKNEMHNFTNYYEINLDNPFTELLSQIKIHI